MVCVSWFVSVRVHDLCAAVTFVCAGGRGCDGGFYPLTYLLRRVSMMCMFVPFFSVSMISVCVHDFCVHGLCVFMVRFAVSMMYDSPRFVCMFMLWWW